MLDSIIFQLLPNDHLYVIVDGEQYHEQSRNILEKYHFSCNFHIIYHDKNEGHAGHALRNIYQDNLKGDYILHADDDDAYENDSFEYVRKIIANDPNKLYIFQMYSAGLMVPISHNIKLNNIGTPCGVIPNIPHLFGKWEYKRGGDYSFYNETAKNFEVRYVHKFIYKIRWTSTRYCTVTNKIKNHLKNMQILKNNYDNAQYEKIFNLTETAYNLFEIGNSISHYTLLFLISQPCSKIYIFSEKYNNILKYYKKYFVDRLIIFIGNIDVSINTFLNDNLWRADMLYINEKYDDYKKYIPIIGSENCILINEHM